MQQLFVSATRQNDGKTLVSLGLYRAFQKRFQHISYMKPVGQQYKLIDGNKIDKDAVLFSKVYDIQDSLPLMSPIAVPKGFTENYILNPNPEHLNQKLHNAHQQLTQDKDFLLIEGTGHAGVGSVFDLSNGMVAKKLGTKVVLVSIGGVGKSIDEILLNKSCFEKYGVEVIGVIINKVHRDKMEKVKNLVSKGLKNHNLDVLGYIPFEHMLTRPSAATLQHELGATLITESTALYRGIEKFLIGDMMPHEALDKLTPNTVLIMPANREGLVMSVLYGAMVDQSIQSQISAVVLTGGLKAQGKVFELIKNANLPILSVEEDSFTVSSKINQMLCKLIPEEKDKIMRIQSLVETHVDMDEICRRIAA